MHTYNKSNVNDDHSRNYTENSDDDDDDDEDDDKVGDDDDKSFTCFLYQLVP